MREGGRWPRTYGRREGLEKGSDEWKEVKRIFDRTHKSDKRGDGALWSKYDKGKPYVVVHREIGRNVTQEDEAQGADDPAFHEVEEDEMEEEKEPVAASNAMTEEQQERVRKSREAAIRKRAEKEAEQEAEREAEDRAYEEAYEEEMGRTEGEGEQETGGEVKERAQEREGTGDQGKERVEGGGKNMRLRGILMNVNGRVQTVRRTEGEAGATGTGGASGAADSAGADVGSARVTVSESG
jgi:hypothetical protein